MIESLTAPDTEDPVASKRDEGPVSCASQSAKTKLVIRHQDSRRPGGELREAAFPRRRTARRAWGELTEARAHPCLWRGGGGWPGRRRRGCGPLVGPGSPAGLWLSARGAARPVPLGGRGAELRGSQHAVPATSTDSRGVACTWGRSFPSRLGGSVAPAARRGRRVGRRARSPAVVGPGGLRGGIGRSRAEEASQGPGDERQGQAREPLCPRTAVSLCPSLEGPLPWFTRCVWGKGVQSDRLVEDQGQRSPRSAGPGVGFPAILRLRGCSWPRSLAVGSRRALV